MCAAVTDCGTRASCVAGRCLPDGRDAAIAQPNVRRLVLSPVDVAYIRRGDASASVPAVITLGRAADGDALLLLRFALTLPPTSTVLEAYLLLERSDAVDADPPPVFLHADRIRDRWEASTLSWARQPRLEDTRSPRTAVTAGRGLVRLDVRDLVRRWAARAPEEQGLAVVAETNSRTGMAFVLTPPLLGPLREAPVASAGPRAAGPFFSAPAGTEESATTVPLALEGGPRLEVYAK